MQGIDVTTVPDINLNGSPEIASLVKQADGSVTVVIRDSLTGKEIRRFGFAAGRVPKAITALADMNQNGSSEIATLVEFADGSLHVIIKDAKTGAFIKVIPAN